MSVDIIGEITEIETIALGSRIRDIARLRKRYGKGGGKLKVWLVSDS